MSVCKPKLPQLTTPKNSSFPISISGPTPVSPYPREELPAGPPAAYLDFLSNFENLKTPQSSNSSRIFFSRGNTPILTPLTGPSTAHSHIDCQCFDAAAGTVSKPERRGHLDNLIGRGALTASAIPPSPYNLTPLSAMSAPPSFRESGLPSALLPPTPFTFSPVSSTPRSALSSHSATSAPGDWDINSPLGAELKNALHSLSKSKERDVHTRTVLTRTVTLKRRHMSSIHTPSMGAPPKGKRRKQPPPPTSIASITHEA